MRLGAIVLTMVCIAGTAAAQTEPVYLDQLMETPLADLAAATTMTERARRIFLAARPAIDKMLDDEYVNFLFVGRIAPNKNVTGALAISRVTGSLTSEPVPALAAEPDYVALGPIWETKLKVMKWAPQGLDRGALGVRHAFVVHVGAAIELDGADRLGQRRFTRFERDVPAVRAHGAIDPEQLFELRQLVIVDQLAAGEHRHGQGAVQFHDARAKVARVGGQRAQLFQRRFIDQHTVTGGLVDHALFQHALERLAGRRERPAQFTGNGVMQFTGAQRVLAPGAAVGGMRAELHRAAR